MVEWRWFTVDELRDEHATRYEVEPADLPDIVIERLQLT